MTKEAVLRVALRLYQEVGYEAASLRRITEELNITVPALYYHFRSKDELLGAAVEQWLEHLLRVHSDVSASLEHSERLWTFVWLHIQLQWEGGYRSRQPYGVAQLLHNLDPVIARPLVERVQRLRDYLRSILTNGIKDGTFDKVHTTATVYALFGIGQQLNYWYQPDGPLSLDRIASMYADMALKLVGCEEPKNKRSLIRNAKASLARAGNS